MEIYVCQPADIDYNDTDYSVYESSHVEYAGTSHEHAKSIVAAKAEVLLANWTFEDIAGATSTEGFHKMILDASQITAVHITGAETIDDLDESDGEKIVWMVVAESHGFSMFETIIAAFKDPKDAAEKVREYCTEKWHSFNGYTMLPRAIPVRVESTP